MRVSKFSNASKILFETILFASTPTIYIPSNVRKKLKIEMKNTVGSFSKNRDKIGSKTGFVTPLVQLNISLNITIVIHKGKITISPVMKYLFRLNVNFVNFFCSNLSVFIEAWIYRLKCSRRAVALLHRKANRFAATFFGFFVQQYVVYSILRIYVFLHHLQRRTLNRYLAETVLLL